MVTEPKPYLNYLDKEMRIMGILSAFCVAVLALVVDKDRWREGFDCLIFALDASSGDLVDWRGRAVGRCAIFYRQRSHLAWYYGQISLAQVQNAEAENSVGEWLRDADSSETWLFYRDGFASLSFGFFQFAVAVAQQQLSTTYPRILTLWFLWRAVLVPPCYRHTCSDDIGFTTNLGLTGGKGSSQ